jgi:serine/threonine protein kinase
MEQRSGREVRASMIVITKAASDTLDTPQHDVHRQPHRQPVNVSADSANASEPVHQHSAADLASAVEALSSLQVSDACAPVAAATSAGELSGSPSDTSSPIAASLLVPPPSSSSSSSSIAGETVSEDEEDDHDQGYHGSSGSGGRSPSARRHKKSGTRRKDKRKSSSLRSKRAGFLVAEAQNLKVGGSMKEPRSTKRSPLIPRSASAQEACPTTPKTGRAPRHEQLPKTRERSESINQTGRLEPVYETVRRKGPKGMAKQVEDYQLGEKLGKGAFGAVYKGLNVRSGQFVALKRMRRENLDEDALMAEVNMLKNLNHPNIVRYIGLIKTTNHLNMVLEYVEGGSLAQVLSSYGFFPESLAAIYLEQVLIGLRYLHSQSVIHRDIKGGNLLITKNGRVKLADFGIALATQGEKDSGARDFSQGEDGNFTLVAGSPFWMAPEVIEMNVPTPACDIWSVGCTLIELLTGFPPYFDMVALSAVFKMVQDEHPPLPDDISVELEQFLMRCFARDPTQRPSAHDLLADPWIRNFSRRDPSEVLELPPDDGTSTSATDADPDADATVSLEEMTGTIKAYNTLREKEYTEKRALNAIDWDQPSADEDRKRLSSSPVPSSAASSSSSFSSSSSSSSSSQPAPSSPSNFMSGSVLLESDLAAVDAAAASMRKSSDVPKPVPAAGDPMSTEESSRFNSSGRSIVGSLRRKKKKERDQIPASMHGGSVRGKKVRSLAALGTCRFLSRTLVHSCRLLNS